jgi:hypothetical protein
MTGSPSKVKQVASEDVNPSLVEYDNNKNNKCLPIRGALARIIIT